MIDIRQAVQTALAFMRDIYDEKDLRKLGVEEVTLGEAGAPWLVTVGVGGAEPASTMSVVEGQGTARRYKLIEIDAESGAVLAMKAMPE